VAFEIFRAIAAVSVLEIKMPGEKLTPAEAEWHEKFPGAKVVHSFEEAAQAVGIAIRK
jgi:hypothetical protein